MFAALQATFGTIMTADLPLVRVTGDGKVYTELDTFAPAADVTYTLVICREFALFGIGPAITAIL